MLLTAGTLLGSANGSRIDPRRVMSSAAMQAVSSTTRRAIFSKFATFSVMRVWRRLNNGTPICWRMFQRSAWMTSCRHYGLRTPNDHERALFPVPLCLLSTVGQSSDGRKLTSFHLHALRPAKSDGKPSVRDERQAQRSCLAECKRLPVRYRSNERLSRACARWAA